MRGCDHANDKASKNVPAPFGRRIDEIKLVAERRGYAVYIEAIVPDNSNRGWSLFSGKHQNMALDLVIEVPASLSLDVEDGSGEAVFVTPGPLDIKDGSGSLEIRGARGDVKIHDGSGSMFVDGVTGSVSVFDGSGRIDVRNVTGDLTVEQDGSGDIRVSSVGGTFRVVRDGSGSIDFDRVAGDFVVERDSSGSIRHEAVKGSVRIPARKGRG